MQCEPELFQELIHVGRNNRFAMEARKRADLALGALLRSQLGWRKDNPNGENSTIRDRAAALIATGEKLMAWEERLAKNPGSKVKAPKGLDDPVFVQWQQVIMASLRGRLPMSNLEKITADRMEELAAQMPAAAWWREKVFSGSLMSLARIVAETGDLTDYGDVKDGDGKPIGYHTISRVWKRMGLAVIDGQRQGRVDKEGKGRDQIAKAWIDHGYSPVRRSVMFVIGDSLEKATGNHYRDVYLAEKARQIAKAKAEGLTVAPQAKIPAKRKDEFRSEGHIRARALRYMEKQLLADLWCAWNGRAKTGVEPELGLPSRPIELLTADLAA